MIVISPYARAHYISHTQYEFGSILKFIEKNWELGSLGTTDVRATSIGDVFDLSHGPRAFEPIAAPLSRAHFLHQKATDEPDND